MSGALCWNKYKPSGLHSFKYHTVKGYKDNVLYWLSEAKKMGIATTVGVTVTSKNIH
ncbi:hypothetical protein QA601_15700 [Chitinispirillales bacterium ANBcel5]|uniref:hypothetical protein n=1 Tax=Cellulosispirillum alkaliphilum TaxID=3039283 RepID=UPI002A592E32|nr:hypothetical protein [Chitinispirillales bacterium ANBcel5]